MRLLDNLICSSLPTWQYGIFLLPSRQSMRSRRNIDPLPTWNCEIPWLSWQCFRSLADPNSSLLLRLLLVYGLHTRTLFSGLLRFSAGLKDHFNSLHCHLAISLFNFPAWKIYCCHSETLSVSSLFHSPPDCLWIVSYL